MSWNRIAGQWKQRRWKAVGHLGRIMNNGLAAIASKHEEHAGRLQEKYEIAKEEAKRQVEEYAILTSTTAGLGHSVPLR